MALNITINGYVYQDNGALAGNTVRYQAFFYPNGTASSAEKWNSVRVSEATSYWNLNLGDADFLGQTGTVLDNSRVLLVYWKGTTNDRNDVCSNMSEWGATELVIDGSSVYSFNTQVKLNQLPNLIWSFPDNGLVDTDYSSTNTSYDTHSWVFGSVTMSHWYTRYGETIFDVNQVDYTNYDWDDGDQDNGLPGASTSIHQWDTAGTYDVDIEVVDKCGGTVSGTETIEIRYRAPIPNIICNEAVGQFIETPNTVVTFDYNGTDIDDRITSIDWTINDSGVYGNTNTTDTINRDDTMDHDNGLGTSWPGESANSGAFTNPGSHVVAIVIHWNDGFNNLTINYQETFTQRRFDVAPVPNITCPEAVGQNITTPDTIVSFLYSGTDAEDRIQDIDWIVNDDSDTLDTKLKTETMYHTNGTGTSWCSHSASSGAFTDSGNHVVEIDVNWHDGWEIQTVNYDETFYQQKFSGPTVSFNQVPALAVMASGVKFVNTSTDTSRVGLGLPDCVEYDWRFTDGGVNTNYLDKPFTYELEVIPGSVDCSTRLCANWSDGFETQQTCVTENVPFETTVIVTEEYCYHNLEIYGTSDDGTITGYSWTVSSGISETGPWSEVWSSPTGLDQQEKDVNFCSVSWYRIDGFVYGGGTTTDSEVLYIDEVCASGTGEVVAVAICEPDMLLDERGNRHMYGRELKPSMKAGRPANEFSQSGEFTLRPFPRPGHLN